HSMAFPPHCGFSATVQHRKTPIADVRRSSRVADREFRSPRHSDGRPVQETAAAADVSPESFPWPHFLLSPCPSLNLLSEQKTPCGLDISNSYPTQVTIEPLTIVRSPRGARSFKVFVGSQGR